MAWRVLELFAGIGGWRYALPADAEVVAAYDIHPAAAATYALNHGEALRQRELATVPQEEIAACGADTWVMSPPCQPFCRMGKKEDLEDPRSRAFLRVLDLIADLRPPRLALENVEGFFGSEAHRRLGEVLDRNGYARRDLRLCPTQLGSPNLRPRAYLVAALDSLREPELPATTPAPLEAYLDDPEDPSLYLNEAELRHWQGLDLVRSDDRRSACFIGGYGRRFVGSGSFLVTDQGVRRFSTLEVARLLGLPSSFRFPQEVGLEARYKLLGNGLSIPTARWVLDHLPC
jgi:site-specific DNA-cytosine methylase